MIVYVDLDGTLVRDAGGDDPAVDVAAEHGVGMGGERLADLRSLTVQYFQRGVSEPYRRAAEVWVEHHDLGLDPAGFAADLRRRRVEGIEPVDGAAGALESLAGEFTLGVITNGAGEVQRGKLERAGLADAFETVIVSGETPYMKPDDGIFELARAELPGDEHAYVADRLAYDVVPARENGFRGVWVGGRATPAADLAVGSVADLTPGDLRAL